jgi:hypothetical protein
VQGLRFVTEIDAPFEVVEWPTLRWPAAEAELRKSLGAGDEPLALISVDQLFRGHIEDADPNDQVAQELVPKFQALRSLIIAELRAPTGVRVGTSSLKIWIMGGFGERTVGLATRGLET